ncbi:MAG: hypothetical protein Q9220_007632 [cf. Caloplaca sp. 1 TL-2023]
MLVATTRFALVAALPSLINAQALTTYTLTIFGKETSVVLPLPQVPTTTVYMTMAGATVTQTTAFPQSVATQTIILTAPADQITSIAGEIPSSYQAPPVTVNPGPIVPITLNGYTTSINLPSSASVPTGAVTLSPIIAPPPPATTAIATPQDTATAQTVINPLPNTNSASTAAAGITSSAAAQASSIAASLSTATGVPASVLVAGAGSASTNLASASATASSVLAGASSAANAASSQATSAANAASSSLAAASSGATSAAGAASSSLATASSQATSAVAGASSSLADISALTTTTSGVLPTGIVTDTSSFVTSTVTSSGSTETSTTAEEQSLSTTTTAESTAESSAAATTSSLGAGNTAAPPNSGVGKLVGGGRGVVVGVLMVGIGLWVL